jgi:hypothetical protein
MRTGMLSALLLAPLGCAFISGGQSEVQFTSDPTGVDVYGPYPGSARYRKVGTTPFTIPSSGRYQIASIRGYRILWSTVDTDASKTVSINFQDSETQKITRNDELKLGLPLGKLSNPPPERGPNGLFDDERRINILGEDGLAIYCLKKSFGRRQQMERVGITPCSIVVGITKGKQEAFALKEGRIAFFPVDPAIPIATIEFASARQATQDELWIGDSKVAIGMSDKAALRSWGEPDKTNELLTAAGKHETWIYDRGSGKTQFVYLENGKVTAISSH